MSERETAHAIGDVVIEVSVILGDTTMPISQLLKMGRGAVIDLDADIDDNVSVYANEQLVAKGDVVIVGEKIAVSITDTIAVPK